MTILDAIFLGILQGVSEFLPISSSGHLVVAQNLLGVAHAGILFEVVVHLGTLLSILVVFRHDIAQLLGDLSSTRGRRYLAFLAYGTVPIASAGLVFKSQVESLFQNIQFVGGAFVATGVVLILSRFIVGRKSPVNGVRSLLIGLAQAVALLPGISRSGVTIGTGLMMGLEPREAAKFSFFLAIPALIGSGILMFGGFLSATSQGESFAVLGAGIFTSFVAGLVSLKVLLRVLFRGNFHWFGAYCLVLGIITMGM
ncbi:MAG: undecaprenyl-diphosphate phosphatase [Fidelibacterota bacterium]